MTPRRWTKPGGLIFCNKKKTEATSLIIVSETTTVLKGPPQKVTGMLGGGRSTISHNTTLQHLHSVYDHF